MNTSLIWERFLIENKRIVTSEELGELSAELSKDRDQVIDYLQHNGYIVRVLRGIFYVKSVGERRLGTYDNSIYEMVAMALRAKGVRNWYFALETALKLNTMTHEYFMTEYVVTDSYRTTKVIGILDSNFKFIKRGGKYFKKGIRKERGIRYSDPERTVLDLMYRDYLKKKDEKHIHPILDEYAGRLDRGRLMDYLVDYPRVFQTMVAINS